MSQYKPRSTGLTRGLWRQYTGRAGRHTADNRPSVPAYSCELRQMHIKMTGRLHKQGLNTRRGWGFSFNLCVNTCVCMLSVPVGGLHLSMHVEARSHYQVSSITPHFFLLETEFCFVVLAGLELTRQTRMAGILKESPALPLERWNYRHVPPDGSPHFFEVGSYWAHWLARLASQPAPGILLFLPPQHCNQHAHKPHLVFMWDLNSDLHVPVISNLTTEPPLQSLLKF